MLTQYNSNQTVTPSRDQLHTSVHGNGQPLVFLHGWGMNQGVWQRLHQQFGEQYSIHCIDLPGYGYSTQCMPSHYDIASVASLVSERLPKNSVIIGWSLGGLIAQYLAATNDPNIKGLITIGSTPKFVADTGWPGIEAKVLDGFQQLLSKNYQQTLKRFLAIQAMGSTTAKIDIKHLQQYIEQAPNPDPLALQYGLDILKSTDLRSDIGNITTPTLRLYGKLDSLVPVASIEAINTLQPCDKHVFTKTAHAPFISAPETFYWVVRDWLTENSKLG